MYFSGHAISELCTQFHCYMSLSVLRVHSCTSLCDITVSNAGPSPTGSYNISSGKHTLPNSNSRTLYTLSRVAMSGSIAPIARSYGGNSWELTSSDYALAHDLVCPSSTDCSITVPEYDGDFTIAVYALTSHRSPDYHSRQMAARFLTQATFGPTRSEMRALADNVSAGTTTGALFNWINAQIAGPMTRSTTS